MRDLREYAKTTNKRLVIWALVILFVVGLGLIAWLYGWSAALMGFICILGGLGVVGLVALLFYFIGIIVKKNRGE